MKKAVSFLIVCSVAVLIGLNAYAADVKPKLDDCPTGSGEKCTNLENPLASKATDVPIIIGTVIKYALGVIGSLTILMFVWGGFQWLTSAGSSDKIKKGTATMVWAAIGVTLVLSSYLILTTYLDYLTGKK
jgi:hypothetical protein